MFAGRRPWIPAALVVAVAALAATWAPAQPGTPQADAFQGKFLSIIKQSDPSHSTSLEEVRVRTLGDEEFLVGVCSRDFPENWQAGLTLWIALDDVSEITVFNSLEDLRDTLTVLDERVAGRE